MNPVKTYKALDLNARNIWSNAAGEPIVRPGLQLVGPGGKAAFSVLNPRTKTTWHYVVTAGSGSTTITVMDEDFLTLFTRVMPTSVAPRAVTYGVVADQIMICSPDFPTQWGIVGAGLVTAVAQPGVAGASRVPLPIPQGLCCAWQGRMVIADGSATYISDPPANQIYIRTFDPGNFDADTAAGSVFDLRTTAGGDLVTTGSRGVWVKQAELALTLDVYSIWDKKSDYCATSYNSVCSVHGQLYGLTERGFKRIDIAGSDEVTINEPHEIGPTLAGPPPTISYPDMRAGRIYATDKGPAISIDRYLYMVDLATGVKSWWYTPLGDLALTGVLVEPDTTEVLVFDSTAFPAARVATNYDGFFNAGSVTGTQLITGILFGRLPVPANPNPVVRNVDYSTDTTQAVAIAVDSTLWDWSTQHAGAAIPATTPVVGVDVFGAGIYQDPRFRSFRANFSERLDQIAVNLQVTGAQRRIGTSLDVTLRGPGKKRRDL